MRYEEAIRRPFSDYKKLGIGILLNIVPIINFIAMGYAFECAKLTLNNKNNLPEWKSFGSLFLKGLIYMLISIIYFVPLLPLIGVGYLVKANLVALVLIIIIGLVYAVGVSYLLPIAIMNYIAKEKFKEAFNFNLIFKKIHTKKYLKIWIAILLISIAASIILGAITGAINYLVSLATADTTIQLVISFVFDSLAMIVSIITFTLYAQVYKEV